MTILLARTGNPVASLHDRTLVRARMRTAGEVLVVAPDALRHLVGSDSELSDLFMRAFILRRVARAAFFLALAPSAIGCRSPEAAADRPSGTADASAFAAAGIRRWVRYVRYVPGDFDPLAHVVRLENLAAAATALGDPKTAERLRARRAHRASPPAAGRRGAARGPE